jgi:hypothetical protein
MQRLTQSRVKREMPLEVTGRHFFMQGENTPDFLQL